MLQQVRTVSEGEITYALAGQGYTIKSERDGLTYYWHPEVPDGPVVLDHNKGPIPFVLLEIFLPIQGVNMDAFCAYLEGG